MLRAQSEVLIQNPPADSNVAAEVTGLRNGLRRLERVSRGFIMRRMNEAMTSAMAGQNIDSVKLGAPVSRATLKHQEN